jgi:uncharacterized repeat protein (TIGR03803 family)
MKDVRVNRVAQILVVLIVLCSSSVAATEQTIYSFPLDGSGGSTPTGGLIFDASGNLYGTTEVGGAYQSGAVFELSPGGGGTWTETVLYRAAVPGWDLPGVGFGFRRCRQSLRHDCRRRAR